MAPPATFYTIGAFPYSQLVTQSDFDTGGHSGGVANEVWFKYVGAGAIILGLAVTPGTFIPRVAVFESDALTPTLNDVTDAGFWTRLTTVTNYWIRVRKSPAGAATADFTFNADTQTLSPTITPGDYVINDDDNYPGIIISPAGVIRGFHADVPGGEMIVALQSGHVLAHDRFAVHGSKMALLDTDLSLISAFDFSPTLSGFPPVSGIGSLFYAMNPSNRNLYSITTTGTVTLVAPAVAALVHAIGVSADGTILYYTDTTKNIRRYDLVGLAAMSDLYTVTDAGTLTIGVTAINGHPGDILVLSDGSIVTYYQNTTASTSVLLHISAAGTLLHSYSYSAGTQSVDHVSRAPNDPSSINIWWFLTNDDTGRYSNFNLSLGTASVTFDSELFSAGVNRVTHTGVMFAPSSSCGFTTLLADQASTATGSPEIPSANSSECCASPGVEGSGETVPGAGVEHPVLLSAAWSGRCDGGGQVDLLPDLTDAEDWSDS
jgi:hypothetical protein